MSGQASSITHIYKEKDLAPHILRQRLRMEGFYSIEVIAETVDIYLKKLSELLGMTITFGPEIQNEAEKVNPDHAGYEGVMMWAESGTHAYTWEKGKFFSIDVYSCSPYNNVTVLEFTRDFFKSTKLGYEATCSRDGSNNLTFIDIP